MYWGLHSLREHSAYSFKLALYAAKRTVSVVGLSGLEPPTSRLSGVRSNRLSYKPIFRLPGCHPYSLYCVLGSSVLFTLQIISVQNETGYARGGD